jgi:single-strand DNA-binding protein
MYELKGTIKKIFDTQTFGSGFTKREFVVTTDGEYPQPIRFQVVKDKVAMLDKLREGERVVVKFDLRGNEYKDRFYVDLNAWKIDREDGAQDAPPLDHEPDFIGNEDEDDMPF